LSLARLRCWADPIGIKRDEHPAIGCNGLLFCRHSRTREASYADSKAAGRVAAIISLSAIQKLLLHLETEPHYGESEARAV